MHNHIGINPAKSLFNMFLVHPYSGLYLIWVKVQRDFFSWNVQFDAKIDNKMTDWTLINHVFTVSDLRNAALICKVWLDLNLSALKVQNRLTACIVAYVNLDTSLLIYLANGTFFECFT